jgi:Tfp pilus assembly protein PilO
VIERLARLASRMPPRQLQLAAGLVLLLAAGLAALVLGGPVAALQAARAERIAHAQSAGMVASLTQLRTALEADIARLSPSGLPRGPVRQSDQLIVDVLAQLNRIGDKHRVSLVRVTPGEQRNVLMFEEMPFETEVGGDYRNVMRWLLDIEQTIPGMSVEEFGVRRHPTSGSIVMQARLALYLDRKKE